MKPQMVEECVRAADAHRKGVLIGDEKEESKDLGDPEKGLQGIIG